MSTTPPGATPPSGPASAVGKTPEELNRELRARVAAASPAPPEPKRESLRDTVESIIFALILAFLFRTFEAEAFVIPTGSMAPTLYGRHKETTCTKCGSHIVVGASDEYNAELGALHKDNRILAAICPNCRYENTQLRDALAFNGDRILVNKFPYEIGEPNRWDVFVFKYPQEPDVNYIKRLVGLPGETIRIRQGTSICGMARRKRSSASLIPPSRSPCRCWSMTTATPHQNCWKPAGPSAGRQSPGMPTVNGSRRTAPGRMPPSSGFFVWMAKPLPNRPGCDTATTIPARRTGRISKRNVPCSPAWS